VGLAAMSPPPNRTALRLLRRDRHWGMPPSLARSHRTGPKLLQGLAGQPKSTHAFARVYINEPFPSEGGEGQGREGGRERYMCV